MATYAQLKVFKETYDLLALIYQTTSNVNRTYRYTLVEKIKNDIIELCITIYKANLTDKLTKPEQINQAQEQLIRITIQCRILGDLKQISAKLSAKITVHTQSIENQLAAWLQYTLDKQ